MTLSRRTLLRAAAGVASRARPNILLLLSDDLRPDGIGALGNPAVRTPHLDSLVRDGTVFRRAHIMGGTVAAVCIPSRAMLFSGLSLFRAHRRMVANVEAAPVLLPEHLAAHGYTTFATGKWHNGVPAFARSFRDADCVYFGEWPVDHLNLPVAGYDPEDVYPAARRRVTGEFSTDMFASAAVRFLERYRSPSPFFLYAGFWAPHDPRMAPQQYQDLYRAGSLPLPRNFLPAHPFDNGELKVRDEMLAASPRGAAEIREHLAAYYAMVTHLDEGIGRVLRALVASRHAANTIVVFTSDNGLALGSHGLMGKQNLYDHSVRVPLVMSGPGVARGETRPALCFLHDLFPTLCEAAGIEVPGGLDGKSLIPALRDSQVRARDSLLLAYRDVQRAIRTEDWKLISYHVGGETRRQLFHVAADPDEVFDLGNQAGQRARIEELSARLAQCMCQEGDPADARWFAGDGVGPAAGRTRDETA